MQDQGCPESTSSATATVASAVEQKHRLPDATDTADTVTEMADNEKSITIAIGTQDQQSSTDTVTKVLTERTPHKYVMTPGEDLFKSLFATPSNSPGSVASSGTLIDPSSRKVSPLDLGTITKGSPTAVKDFAYPSPNDIRVDPVAMIEEETKKGLLKQLKKKTAAEEKLAATNKTLGAELESTKAAVKNTDTQADLAKAHANAMTVSNVVLRQIIKDLCHGLSHEDTGSQAQGTASEGESQWDQQNEKSLQMHLRDVDESSASAYGRMVRLENASAVRGQNLDNTFGERSVQKEKPSLIVKLRVPKKSESVAVQLSGPQASNELQTSIIGSSSSTKTSEGAQPKTTVQEPEAGPKEDVKDFSEKYGFNPAELSRILDSVSPTAQKKSEDKDTEVTQEKEALREVEEHEVEPTTDEAVLPTLQEYQRRDLNLDQDSAVGRSQEMADPIATGFDDATPDQDDSSESAGEDQVQEEDEDTTLSTAENPALGSDCDEDAVIQEPINTAIPNHDQVQAVADGHEDGPNESYEFSEAAGPATLWGILRSDQTENDANDTTDTGDEAPDDDAAGDDAAGNDATVQDAAVQDANGEDATGEDATGEDATDEDATGEDATGEDATGEVTTCDDAAGVLEPPGPATLGGTLQSSQDEISAEDYTDAGDDTTGVPETAEPSVESSLSGHEANDNTSAGEETAGAPDAAGPALLWGILRSEQAEEEAEDQEVASETAPNSSEAVALALPCESLRSEQDRDQVENQDVADEVAVGALDEDAPGPATLWGILKSDYNPSTDHSFGAETSENGRTDGDVVLEDSESTDAAGAQDQDGTQSFSFAHDTTSSDSNENTNSLHDINDNEEEPSSPTGTPIVEETLIAYPHGSVVVDDVTVTEVDTQEVIAEEAMVAIDTVSTAVTTETVTDPIGGSKVVEESEYKLEIETTQSIHLHDSTTLVDADTSVSAIEATSEDAGDATVAQKEDQEKEVTEANTSEVTGTSEQPEESDEKENAQLVEDEAVTGPSPFPAATVQDIEDPHEGKTLDDSTVPANMQATSEDTDDHELQNVADGSATTTAKESDTDSAVVPAQTPSPPSYPRASPEHQVEEFDFVGPVVPVPQAKRVKDPEKRRLERARKNAKVKEEKVLRRQMEEEAKNSPEAVARREAEEIKALGEKRLKLQQARMDKW